MEDENDKLEEDFYQFLNLPRNVSARFPLRHTGYIKLTRIVNRSMCFARDLFSYITFILSCLLIILTISFEFLTGTPRGYHQCLPQTEPNLSP